MGWFVRTFSQTSAITVEESQKHANEASTMVRAKKRASKQAASRRENISKEKKKRRLSIRLLLQKLTLGREENIIPKRRGGVRREREQLFFHY